MAESILSFTSSSSFRNTLLSKNLPPYTVVGVFSPPQGSVAYETSLTVSPVLDSPDELISDSPFADQLYPLNEYGPDGGYNNQITYNGPPLPVDSNKGEYDPNDTVLDIVNEFFIDAAYIENIYGPQGGFNQLIVIDSIQNNNKIYLPYWDPPTFRPSSYSPYEILLSDNPTGSDGTLSQDSYIARLGAETLKKLFQDRIDAEIYQNTIGLVNLESLSDPFEASLIATGQEPLIYKNWRITVPENPLLAAADFITRLGGAYWPVSPIPGDYFQENVFGGAPSQQTSVALSVTNQLTGGLLGPILNVTRSPSQIFLANTGNGQRSALFANLNFNRYQPGYQKNFGGLLGVAQGLVNLAVNIINPDNGTLLGGYYVGNTNAEPSTITSPPNQIPVNPFGKQDPVPVYGPSELGILYEGNEEKLNFGLKGKSYTDGGGVDGQFVWTSPKYKGNAGFKPTVGGGTGELDQEFNIISSSYQSNESTNLTFKESSILDQTQRLIDSADNVSGIARLKHVGNAINQVSKVFNDGYKEMTKGSKVVSYKDNTTGDIAGTEYCRVFAKDTPYYTYADLQKTDGITTTGRRFTNSVFDNTFNLNIAPTRNPGSTNIVANNDVGLGGYAKKYMFSIENLAWRTSSRPGFTYDELPVCEKGPNGGRVMWFPPYDISFSDSSRANWNATSFLGRPEPIYTYKDSSRSGSLKWKIIVDHPSALNTIIEKQLKGKTKERIDSIIDSFFAGCVKYDIYELAKKFNTIPVKDLYTYQEVLNNPRLTPEELEGVKVSIPQDNQVQTDIDTRSSNTQTKPTENTSVDEFQQKYLDFAFYFEDNIPGPATYATVANQNYKDIYDTYTSSENKTKYKNTADKLFKSDDRNINVSEFFSKVIESNFKLFSESFIKDSIALMEEGATIFVRFEGSASALGNNKYNIALSERRINSIQKFFDTWSFGGQSLSKYIKEGKFKIDPKAGTGEDTVIPKQYTEFGSGTTQEATTNATPGFDVNCTENVKDKNGAVGLSQIYSVSAMACRRVRVSEIRAELPKKPEPSPPPIKTIKTDPDPKIITIPVVPPPPTVDIQKKLKEGISKKILRNLFSECDYFEIIKETNPMVLETIKDKIKYFNPAFHSMTPEGLNARLTFLNQCVRPGETIPTIGTDGKPKFNDAINTSFGAPPVLILRIGDFFHTKIIPNGVSFSYEPLLFDMNPEGIGIQPMIVNVSMEFNIIGGMGLAKPVEQLQNALSFNYYANTEIYDERAVATEDTSALDKIIEQSILESQPATTVNNVAQQQQNNGGTTIGEIITNIPTASGQTGEIGYQKIMDSLLTETPKYFTMLTNKLESINAAYNFGVVQLLNKTRDYSTGTTIFDVAGTGENVEIYGKPKEWEKEMDNQIKLCQDYIDYKGGYEKQNPIIVALENFGFNIDDDSMPIRAVRNNMKIYIQSLSETFKNGIATTIQEMVQDQQNYAQIIRKINLVARQTDGKIIDSGVPRVYAISGLTDAVSESSTQADFTPADTYAELIYDYKTLYQTTTKGFNTIIGKPEYNIAFGTPTYDKGKFYVYDNEKIQSEADYNFFLIMARVLTDKNKKNEFINSVIKGDELVKWKTPTNLKKKFEKVVDDLADIYKNELKKEEKNFTNFKKDKEYKSYTEGIDEKMYPAGKTRKFQYTTEPQPNQEERKKLVSDLYKTVNEGDKSTYIGKVKFD